MTVKCLSFFDAFIGLTDAIHDLERKLGERDAGDARVARLQTMPRVGRIAALTFVPAVDDVIRFPNSRKLEGYTGLAPTVRSSGERTEYGSISRQGCSELRAAWVQIANLVREVLSAGERNRSCENSSSAGARNRWCENPFSHHDPLRSFKACRVHLDAPLLRLWHHKYLPLVRESLLAPNASRAAPSTERVLQVTA